MVKGYIDGKKWFYLSKSYRDPIIKYWKENNLGRAKRISQAENNDEDKAYTMSSNNSIYQQSNIKSS